MDVADMASVNSTLGPPSGCASPLRHVSNANASLLQRPFTASGARKTSLLVVQVHWGEHVDRLVGGDRGSDRHGDERPSTYVALRTTHGKGDRVSVQAAIETDQTDSYELKSSPFATTRVAERTAHPLWNELLLVSLPIGWRKQENAHDWELHVDVVLRDPSQQEDSLLSTVALQLEKLALGTVPEHLAIDLPCDGRQSIGSVSSAAQLPRIYMSLSETGQLEDPSQVVELTLHDLEDASTVVSPEHPLKGGLVVVSTRPLEKGMSVKDLFERSSATTASSPDNCTWMSPVVWPCSAHAQTPRLQWEFPMLFISQTRRSDAAALIASSLYSDELHAHLFTFAANDKASDEPTTTQVASAVLQPRDVSSTGEPVTCTPTLHTTTSSHAPGQLRLNSTIRRWNSDSWASFLVTSSTRRVITTNRRHRKRSELQSLKWTGAICRGLNRYPVSSLCDEGGLSGLLARFLASTNFSGIPSAFGFPREQKSPDVDAVSSVQTQEASLNRHIGLLQQEVVSKQLSIQKESFTALAALLESDGFDRLPSILPWQIQMELENMALALQKCGAELVATKSQARTREEQIFQLRSKLDEMENRSAQQLRENLADTEGVNSLRLDGQGAHRMNMLLFKYRELEQTYQEVLNELEDAKRALAVYGHLERKYCDLEQAHVVQAGLLQRLQKDKSQGAQLQRTVLMQEKVICKLQKAVTWQHETPLDTQVAETMESASANSLAVRVHALEDQLQSNAKTAAAEIGRLKMRVMELEAQLSLDCSNPKTLKPG